MAQYVIDDGQISVNSQLYKMKSPLYAQYISPLTGKVNVGDASLDNQVNLNTWSISDQRGGLGVSEMDESVHADRYWWGNCITEHPGHLFLPRLVSEVKKPPTPSAGTSDASGEWTWTNPANSYDEDILTYANVSLTAGTAGWTDYLELTFTAHNCANLYIWIDREDAEITDIEVGAYYDSTWNVLEDTWNDINDNAWTKIAIGSTKSVTKIRVKVEKSQAANTKYTRLYEFMTDGAESSIGAALIATVNFNAHLYFAIGANIWRLDETNGDRIYLLNTFASTITALIVSEANSLYCFLGDTDNYWYMATAETFTDTNVTAAYWGIHWDAKLFKWKSDGTGAYATDPSHATPTWTALTATLDDIAGEIERFFIGKDATGEDVIYCATNSRLKVLDFANDIWLDSALKLPNHPVGGQGATYWHDGHYISAGLGVKRYVTGSTATISEVGLNRDDGIPSEYNGEITFLLGEAASDDMFALVDASLTSGNSKSGLYAFNGRAWRCWWIDTSNNGAMTVAIISSAYGYRLYWDCSSKLYYIDIHRGLQNVDQLIGTQTFMASGIHISPWFDAGTQGFDKLLARMISYAKRVTTTETIKIYYRINKATIDIDLDLSASWTTLVSLDTAGENGQVSTALASGAGVAYETIQFRIDLARDTTTTLTPDLQGLVAAYELMTGESGYWVYTFTLVCDDTTGGTRARAKNANIKTALELGTLVPIIFDNSGTTHYCRLKANQSIIQTGEHFNNEYDIQAVEV